jgi:LuxR family transcriptional regulator, maltose regulon positive regulatory protein
MTDRRRSKPRVSTISEAELAAASPSLFARPSLWRELVLPSDAREQAGQSPWRAYWSVRLGSLADAAADRAVLEAASVRFQSLGDRLGALLAVAAAIETYYYDETNLEPLDGWIAHLERALAADGVAGLPNECAAEVMACGCGILLRQPGHRLLAGWATQGPRLLTRLAPGPSRLKYAAFVVQYHLWRGEFAGCALILDVLPGIDLSLLRPPEALLWLHGVAAHARFTADIERGSVAVRQALDLIERHGLALHAYNMHGYGSALALADGDVEGAAVHLEAMRATLTERSQEDQTHYWHLAAGLALLRGQTRKAVELARHTLELSGEIGGSYRNANHRLSLAAALFRAGELLSAREHALAVVAQARGIDAALSLFSAGLLASHLHEQLGDRTAADALLAEALAVGRTHDYRVSGGWRLPQMLAERMARAIEAGIEADYACHFARCVGLRCPDGTLEAWPWPLVLHGFGEFSVRLNGERLATVGARVSQRPLDLLRLLLAHGGTSVPVSTALEALWPEADHEQQRKAFDAALLRLRRSLGDDTLLQLEGGQLRLDRERCWSDVAALALTDWSVAALGGNAPALIALSRRLLRLARAPLLDGLEAPWALAARERARRRFVLAVGPIAERLETLSPADAVRLYDGALQTDPLAESLWRRLIALHLQHGERSEALRTWHQCKALLSLHGSAASQATLSLVRDAAL